jgi:hypothetical protein
MQIDAALIPPILAIVAAVIAAFWRSETRSNGIERRIDAETIYNARTFATKDGIVNAVNGFTEAVQGLRSDVQSNISGLRYDMKEDRRALAERLERIENRVYPSKD